ncbi:MAG: FAD-dependent oxidoreductase [Phaeodactylibacter sp.]|nr:FAD-dependent oxidoreductase [Phaeodactylibacter sp.]
MQLRPFHLIILLALLSCGPQPETIETDVLVLGGGTGGTAAGIQAARLGARTIIAEPSEWLGGMLTAAGVSATDGNHAMPAGIWGEFRQRLRGHYGGAEALATGWVSYTQFEPHVGAEIFAAMAEKEAKLQVWYRSTYTSITRKDGQWEVLARRDGQPVLVRATILIDGTGLGDVAAAAGAAYSLGMDARSQTGESIAPQQANDIIQDLTYAAILKDYGPAGQAHLLSEPEGYKPALFACSCQKGCDDETEKPHPCETMMTYARLPNDKYMINWPSHGNDYYLNVVEMGPEQREEALKAAKLRTLQFLYFIQHELGYTNLGLADDEFPTPDRLPFEPYYREGRRIHGLARLGLNHILMPYETAEPLYRAGIAVGDYPIDHHHKERPDAPKIDFPPVPSFSIPAGSLIPKDVEGLLVADKAISVTNIANGSTRLQPVILQVGQAAGALAALAVQKRKQPREVPIRALQDAVLAYGGYLAPSYDIGPELPHFQALQRIAATGILRGTGEPHAWANRTWFYPDSTITVGELWAGLRSFEPELEKRPADTSALASLELIAPILVELAVDLRSDNAPLESEEHLLGYLQERWASEPFNLSSFDTRRPLNRTEIAVLLDLMLDPFHAREVGASGLFQ